MLGGLNVKRFVKKKRFFLTFLYDIDESLSKHGEHFLNCKLFPKLKVYKYNSQITLNFP